MTSEPVALVEDLSRAAGRPAPSLHGFRSRGFAMLALGLGLSVIALLPGFASAASAAPFLWQIDGPKTRHYLLGSLHLLPDRAKTLPLALEQAYAISDALVLESDLGALAAPEQQLQLLTAAQSEQPLNAVLPLPLYERLRKRAAELGLPLALCEPYKPWFCALTLEVFELQQHGFRPELGLDQRFYERARADRKPVYGLETPEAHLALFSQMTPQEAQALLEASLDRMSTQGGTPEALLQMWTRGDAEALLAVIQQLKQKSPLLYERLLARRNRLWLPRLEQMLKSDQPTLIVVGAAHLYGEDGLLALLRQKGYRPRALAVQAPAAARTGSGDR